ncbi:MAG TPA: chemotaxis protein CheA [Cerasibacillus sp.]|uniref:chemotaxis protein CheA n=1 Tax=Cerasibacillus sp. TaxID=2498711 RepID=UPI002F41011F
MDTTQYLSIFIDESTEHLNTMSDYMLELEKNPSDKSIIEEIFRAAHTLKGMSATMGYNDMADLTHKLENVFDAIRYDKLNVQVDMMDVLFEVHEQLLAMVEDIANGGTGEQDISDLVTKLEQLEKGEQPGPISESPTKEDIHQETSYEQAITDLDEFELSILNESSERGFSNYEITVQLSEDCLLKAARTFMVFEVLEKHGEVIKADPPVNDLEEENFDFRFKVLFITKHPEDELKKKLKKISEVNDVIISSFSINAYKKEKEKQLETNQKDIKKKKKAKEKSPSSPAGRQVSKTIRVNIERLDILMNLFEELVIDRGRLEQIASELNHQELQETVERMTRVSGDLQNIILTMRMVPVEQVFSRFPRMIRKLSREMNKDIAIKIIGAETELDRTVIDEIGDPLVHLLRNAVDHGIEKPEERRRKGKPEQGTIELKAYHSGNHVFIEITDDGAGINREKVLKKAIENGVIHESQADTLKDQEVYELILASGFSTAEVVSDVSGRGVGLDVVRTKIESLGGRVSIDSEYDKGSVFSIQLPLTLSIMSVLLVEIEKEKYAIPLSSIIETAIIEKKQILSAHHKKVIDFRGNVVPLVFLKDIFDVPQQSNHEEDEYESIVIVKKGEKMAALVVDSFIGQQEVVLKSLGKYLQDVFAISGATILGDGQVALIIDTNALVK